MTPLILTIIAVILNIVAITVYPVVMAVFVLNSSIILPLLIAIGFITYLIYIIPIRFCQSLYNGVFLNKLVSEGRTQMVFFHLILNFQTEFGGKIIVQLLVTLIMMLPIQVFFVCILPLSMIYRVVNMILRSIFDIDIQADLGMYMTKVLQFIAPRLDHMLNNWINSIQFVKELLSNSVVIDQNSVPYKRFLLGLIRPIKSWRSEIPNHFY
jgi:hypothetical protein